MQPLAQSEWDVRDAVPLTDAGHVRMLDAVDQRLDSGVPSAGLAAYLERNGIRFLIMRNDLDYGASDTTRPIIAHEVLSGSPGLTLVKTFGPPVGGGGTAQIQLDQELQRQYPAVEVYQVAGPAENRVATATVASTVQVSGGPEGLLPLTDDAVLGDATTVLTGDLPAGYHAGSTVLTDSLRRREVNYGANPLSTSATLSLADPLRLANKARDFLPFPGNQHESIAELRGALQVSASSSASDPNACGGSVPADQPFSAFDSDPSTAWRTDPITPPVGQWLQIDFEKPTPVSHARCGSRPARRSPACRRVPTTALPPPRSPVRVRWSSRSPPGRPGHCGSS